MTVMGTGFASNTMLLPRRKSVTKMSAHSRIRPERFAGERSRDSGWSQRAKKIKVCAAPTKVPP